LRRNRKKKQFNQGRNRCVERVDKSQLERT